MPEILSTYRLQLHGGFTLTDARALVPYLSRLGVSHIHCSPLLRSRRGSLHGYDVVDPTMLDPELGTDADLAALHQALAERGMGLVVDIVPNHMAASQENPLRGLTIPAEPTAPLVAGNPPFSDGEMQILGYVLQGAFVLTTGCYLLCLHCIAKRWRARARAHANDHRRMSSCAPSARTDAPSSHQGPAFAAGCAKRSRERKRSAGTKSAHCRTSLSRSCDMKNADCRAILVRFGTQRVGGNEL